ncbi:putative membrane protein [Desulfitobacterium dichloroeliminans LMG P-21439]|uniref:Putative membrane protein n=1 Tax=Desulfitobacterium dichloroeliminans (strain LMG P-21439 / DCA1) TaxID=871963 RepID=L0FAU5_DESDL|nr:DUF2085 domain-containing protein [Desulfitobacterium dichloroeliminans]AGA69781.1 putative membrane protein [Desulfitobacterium dichloroeliminans LMG P-21439]
MRVGKALNYLFLCHQLPERSFFFRGHQFPICARCTGILFGYIIGGLIALKYHHIPFVVLILLLAPLGIDGGAQYLGFWKSTNRRRLFTGIAAGIAADFLLAKILLIGINHGKLLYHYVM